MRYRHALGLLLVSVIWGTTFVAVKTAMDHASPVLFVGIRFALASAAAIPLVRWREPGLGLNVSLVPAWAFLITGHRITRLSLLGLVLTLPGLWLLTSPGAGSWSRGDSWTLVCAVLYALYIILVERSAKRHAPGTLLFSQLAATAVVALVAAPILERPRFEPTASLLAALALTAFIATTGTTWLQLRCQPKVGPTRTALIFAGEPVFAAFFSYLWFGERLGVPGWAGGGLILAGMLISEFGAARAGQAVPPLPPAVPPRGDDGSGSGEPP